MSDIAAGIEHWQRWIGREEQRIELIAPEPLRRFAAAIGEDLDVERAWPSLGHWAFFLPVAPPEALGPDGHPGLGGFLPPVTLPRRMFAAAEMRFDGRLELGAPAERLSTVRDVALKRGRSGNLVLVQIEHRIRQHEADRIVETQTIVYREAGALTSPIVPGQIAPQAGDLQWTPGPIDLFRFSAVTFNSHRIHYDLPYATGEEGYPALVVHGPFTACRLFRHALGDATDSRGFGFRAVAPIFCDTPVILRRDDQGRARALRADGTDAMIAEITPC